MVRLWTWIYLLLEFIEESFACVYSQVVGIHGPNELTENDYHQAASYGRMKSIIGGEKTCFQTC